MGIMKGLKAMEKGMDRPSANDGGAKVRWLKLEDGQSAKVRFINELDENTQIQRTISVRLYVQWKQMDDALDVRWLVRSLRVVGGLSSDSIPTFL